MMHSKPGLSYIIPAYNEEVSIINTIQRLHDTLLQLNIPFEIILVNDGSKDKTLELAKQSRGVKIVNHPINIGYGNSLKSGVKVAQYDWIGIVDADGTYPIEDIPLLIREMERGFDMVVASRRNINKVDKPLKKLFRWIFTTIIKILFRGNIEDPNSGFRLFKRNLIINLMPFLCGTFSFTTSLTILAMGIDSFICYIPIQYTQRTGKSKVKHLRDTVRTIQLVIQGITFVNPIKFFLLLSIFMIFFIFIPSMFLALFNMHTLSLYYMVFGTTVTLLIGIGVIGDIIRISTNRKMHDLSQD